MAVMEGFFRRVSREGHRIFLTRGQGGEAGDGFHSQQETLPDLFLPLLNPKTELGDFAWIGRSNLNAKQGSLILVGVPPATKF